jgi:signal transduction histidine kinase
VEIELAGLIPALQSFAATVERIYKISCVLTFDESAGAQHRYSSILAAHLYRIAQEAVNNSIKHGKAKRAVITLADFQDHGLLKIQDDGIGFQAKDEKKLGLGLRSMRYRSRSIGAQFKISRGAGGGTVVTCSFPYTHKTNVHKI